MEDRSRLGVRFSILDPRSSILGLLFALAFCGCEGLLKNQGLPQDPLFANRKPVETKAEIKPPVAIAYSEPGSTNEIDVGLAQHPDQVRPDLARAGKSVPGILTGNPRQK